MVGLVEAWDTLTEGAPTETGVDDLVVVGQGGHLASRLPVERVAVASVGAALLAAASLARSRGSRSQTASVDRGAVAAAVRSERYFLVDGKSAGMGFAALSRFWPAETGWVRTHANYPWHRDRLYEALDLAPRSSTDAVAEAISARSAGEVEDLVVGAGGIAGAVRTAQEWAEHPQGRAVAAEPLIGHELTGDAPPRRRDESSLPAEGVRVLDLTRVIAGPVCTRYLAALGADVVRLDPPGYPDMGLGSASDTLLGKRSAILDLDHSGSRATLDELLAQVDVVVRGYRPGALEHHGLGEHELADRFPGLVIVSLCAWGHTGPWASRRGFDSIVQAVTGIADVEGGEGHEHAPGALPCQLLDHGTGYLAAAAALDGLRRQAEQGGTHVRRVSLARTARWLGTQTRDDTALGDAHDDSERWMTSIDSRVGRLTAVLPPGQLGDQPLTWLYPSVGYGADAAAF